MTTSTTDDRRLRDAVSERLNAHDLLGVLELGAPPTEYEAEANDFAALIAAGEAITPDVVATVWHKWFGDPSEAPAAPDARMAALAADLQTITA
jgi:hypothetical protein